MDYCKYVDVFQGCSTVDLPPPEGVAASWHFVKAITGNTTPAATLPFGKYSVCAYTRAYPTGYGDHMPNCCPSDLKILPEGARFYGLSHFHQSGTGTIDYYYNYAVTLPFIGEKPRDDGYQIISEDGRPGYYSLVSQSQILSEATVSKNSVYHRFTFPDDGGKLVIDFTNNGLLKSFKNHFGRPERGCVTIISESEVCAEIVFDGLTHYFYYCTRGAHVASLMKNNEKIQGSSVSFSGGDDIYGAFFLAETKQVNARLGVSIKGMQQAVDGCKKDEGGFCAVRKAAYSLWNEYIGRIEIENDSEADKIIFYSNLYHSLVKPSDRSGECPLWDESAFFVDFSTMWDIYKTELPLIFTLYRNEAAKIVKTIFDFGEHAKALPHTAVLKKGFLEASKQACMLAELSVCDAFYRSVPADYNKGIQILYNDINRESYKDIMSGVVPKRVTHLLDTADACAAVCELAREVGREDIVRELQKTATRWRECYDEKTGLLIQDADYYEGTLWNYSFRLHHYIEERIALAGGRDKTVSLLDRFFGFTHPESVNTRFEGFNNEPDIETPYLYHYCGRHDRISEIIDLSIRFMFKGGRGGIPGNNDSGGLSSCYVWNSIGVFPVSGRNLYIIGTPYHKKSVLNLPDGKSFTVRREGEGIYVKEAFLDGKQLKELAFKASRLMAGGELSLVMTADKSKALNN